MPPIIRPNRMQLINARKVKSSVAYPFSKRVRTFFAQNNLGEREATYFKAGLKYMKNEEEALKKLKRFISLHSSERQEIVGDEFELVRSMSFRLGEGGKQRPLRTQPKRKRKD